MLTGTQSKNPRRIVEALVSKYIGQMPFLWLNVNDAPGPEF